MPKKAKINVKPVGQDLITFNNRNVARIRILTCINDSTEIKDNKTGNTKIVDCLKMTVIDLDDDKEKEFNPVSSRLNNKLNEINDSEGLIENELRIERIGSGFQTHWKVESILKPKKA